MEPPVSTDATATWMFEGRERRAPPLPPALHVVATPIGNLADITLRALDTLAACPVIACEDTRTTARLLDRYAITGRRVAYTEHNAERAGPRLLDAIAAGTPVALVSDAGTPLVSDPGQRLVAAAVARDLDVVPLPGASAPLAALVASGLMGETFTFTGFLPGRRKGLLEWAARHGGGGSTIAAFEAPGRIAASLAVLAEALGTERRAVVAREITKLHETHHRGTLGTLAGEFAAMDRVRGEIVLVLEAAREASDWTDEAVDAALDDALSRLGTKDAAAEVAAASGRPRRDLYRRALERKGR